MTIPNISNNQLVDTALLNAIIDDVNAVSSRVVNSSSPIFGGGKVVTTYLGGFAIATNKIEVSHKLGTDNRIPTSESRTVSFGKTFLYPPLVFLTFQTDVSAETSKSLVITSNLTEVTNTNCTFTALASHGNSAANNLTTKYFVNVLAIGLVQT